MQKKRQFGLKLRLDSVHTAKLDERVKRRRGHPQHHGLQFPVATKGPTLSFAAHPRARRVKAEEKRFGAIEPPSKEHIRFANVLTNVPPAAFTPASKLIRIFARFAKFTRHVAHLSAPLKDAPSPEVVGSPKRRRTPQPSPFNHPIGIRGDPGTVIAGIITSIEALMATKS